ncbi:MAG: hemolysin III family protein [bacterium]
MFSKLREPMNGFTHFLGVLFAVTALNLLLTRQGEPLTETHVFTFTIYGVSMFMLFLFSTLYHWLPLDGKKLEVFRKIDHIMIFVFIAASYTPICAIIIKGTLGYVVIVIVWLTTLAGFFMKLFWLNAPRKVYTAIYLLMGWVVMIAIYPLFQALSPLGILWFCVGGVFYTVGAIIYALKKPDPIPGIFGFHEIFHLFILGGCFSHFMMIYLCV